MCRIIPVLSESVAALADSGLQQSLEGRDGKKNGDKCHG